MTIQITDVPLDRHGLLHRTAARKVGVSDDRLTSAVKHGELIRLASGVFMPPLDPAFAATEKGKDELYRQTCLAGARRTRVGTAPLSHQSAAAVHRLPMLRPDRDLIHVIRGGPGGSARRGGRFRHSGTVPDDDIVVVDGIHVTSLRRTAVDVAAAGDFAQALTVIDAAIRRGVTRDGLTAALAGRRPEGHRIVRRAIAHGDGRSESPGESWSRAQMLDADLPLPVLQRKHVLEGHVQYPDFDWSGRVVGEFDGLVKYQGTLNPDEDPRDALVREKEREDRFRRAGIHVVRWTWSMLGRGRMIPMLIDWLRRAGVMA
ncbi:MAG: hypothetical protein QM809_09530 [Gordonia sp. (in: high G+C Gram-positive bacteria)]|uniref:hypothetical protein n=1 Tax=Gordonia sp. (in: high G+C Gram-positive bacteria) TaxID=84139 RepID=UPI0039E697B0